MTVQTTAIPRRQFAVQLTGPGELKLNPEKDVFQPGPHQLLARVEAVGLCFSDLKLLKQFSAHPRKGEIASGISREVLAEIPSYVPGEQPTVPGHEVACRIVAVGSEVRRHQVGERCLLQTDYRGLLTAGSNAAFGYTFEGGLQEYVLMDERVVIDAATGERYLIPVPEDLSASAVALVEPWACVEGSYAFTGRQTIKPGGRLLVVVEVGHAVNGLVEAMAGGLPASVTAFGADASRQAALAAPGVPVHEARTLEDLPLQSFDDIVYFGAARTTIEALNDKLAARGIINIVLGGRTIGELVSVGVGRVHYGMTRWIGTTGADAAASYAVIPATGELRAGDRALMVGAGGPMGQMHAIRGLCAGIPELSVVGTDVDDARLESLRLKAAPLAHANGVPFQLVNTAKEPLQGQFSYHVVLVPAGPLVASAIRDSADHALINVFAGIPAPVRQDLDLDTYIARHCYMFGTSGSEVRDMQVVLGRLANGQLDTNTSVDAVAGMAGAVDGLTAVEQRTLAGKIIIYPMLHDLGLLPLTELATRLPTVAAKLDGGRWSRAAEEELLRVGNTPSAPKAAGLVV